MEAYPTSFPSLIAAIAFFLEKWQAVLEPGKKWKSPKKVICVPLTDEERAQKNITTPLAVFCFVESTAVVPRKNGWLLYLQMTGYKNGEGKECFQRRLRIRDQAEIPDKKGKRSRLALNYTLPQ